MLRQFRWRSSIKPIFETNYRLRWLQLGMPESRASGADVEQSEAPGGLGIWLSQIPNHNDACQRRALIAHPIKNPTPQSGMGFVIGCLTMTYSHMGKPHTTIGAEWFHF